MSSGFTVSRKGIALSTAAIVALTLQGCATPSSGSGEGTAGLPATVDTISQEDKAQGAKAHPQLLAEFGGEATGPQAAYVEQVGKKIAIQSNMSNATSDFTVTLLNSSVNNAFAIPGGYVYVTRQLTSLMNNEAELAGVLGHEVGHVAAEHAKKRQKAATKNSILGVLGTILSGVLLGDTGLGRLGQQLFSQGSQALTLKYSREQELEADNLGIAYLKRSGYDPRAMATVLESLARQNALDAQLRGSTNQAPQWASTHPNPETRVSTALAQAGNVAGVTNRETFLARIDGLIYGDDPKQGIVDGNEFIHPELRLQFRSPNGFYMINGTRAVSINGQSGQAQFSTGPYSGNLESYVQSVFNALTENNQQKITPSEMKRTTVNGLPAAYGIARVNNGQSQLDVTVFAYDFGDNKAYHFLTITPAGQASTFSSMFQSVRRISAAEAGQVRARKLDVVTVKAGDTLQSLASRMAFSDAKLERFLVLNGLQSNSVLRAGQQVKIVTY